jgi:hypothetical protein
MFNHDEDMAFCAVLASGMNLIYLEDQDGKHWIEPCVVTIHQGGKIGLRPLQAFAEPTKMEKIDKHHILCTYIPEPGIEESYRKFLKGYLKDSRDIGN